jgi:hypothetical protein
VRDEQVVHPVGGGGFSHHAASWPPRFRTYSSFRDHAYRRPSARGRPSTPLPRRTCLLSIRVRSSRLRRACPPGVQGGREHTPLLDSSSLRFAVPPVGMSSSHEPLHGRSEPRAGHRPSSGTGQTARRGHLPVLCTTYVCGGMSPDGLAGGGHVGGTRGTGRPNRRSFRWQRPLAPDRSLPVGRDRIGGSLLGSAPSALAAVRLVPMEFCSDGRSLSLDQGWETAQLRH